VSYAKIYLERLTFIPVYRLHEFEVLTVISQYINICSLSKNIILFCFSVWGNSYKWRDRGMADMPAFVQTCRNASILPEVYNISVLAGYFSLSCNM
jgi:hypothetical protein